MLPGRNDRAVEFVLGEERAGRFQGIAFTLRNFLRERAETSSRRGSIGPKLGCNINSQTASDRRLRID